MSSTGSMSTTGVSTTPGRPITPPPIERIRLDDRDSSSWVTPASPTRPGPPITAITPVKYHNSGLTSPPSVLLSDVLPVTARSAENGTANTPEPVIVEPVADLPLIEDVVEEADLLRRREKALHHEQKAIEKAIIAEKRRRARRIPQMDDDDLNAMRRSAQKLVRSVHIAPPAYGAPEGDLDLNPSPEEEFTLDKLRSHLERLYSGFLYAMLRVIKEVIRLRSWEEHERTATALIVYFISWYFGRIFTSISLFVTMLVLIPSSRGYCFGPGRHQVTLPLYPRDPNSTTTLTVLTGPEIPWGPAASEAQATEWAEKVEALMMSIISPTEAKSTKGKEMVQKAQREVNGVMVKDMEHEVGNKKDVEEMSKREMAIHLYGKPGMQILGGLIDKWERIAK